MTDRRTVQSPEYQEGYIWAKGNHGDVTKVQNPYIAGTTPWCRWNVGWNNYVSEAKEGTKQ